MKVLYMRIIQQHERNNASGERIHYNNDFHTECETTEGKSNETYQMGDILSRRCFCSAQGLIRDEACTERPEPFRPIRLCTAYQYYM